MFAKGDLIYIPQAAILYGLAKASIHVIDKPSLALFLDYSKEEEGYSTIIMNGKKWLVKDKDIYLNQENQRNVSSAC